MLVINGCINLIDVEANAQFIGFQRQAVTCSTSPLRCRYSLRTPLPGCGDHLNLVDAVATVQKKALVFELVIGKRLGERARSVSRDLGS